MTTHHRLMRLARPLTPGLALTLSAALVTGCSQPAAEGETPAAVAAETTPQDAFFAALATHCGKAYAGRLVSDDPVDADFVGAPMVMHVADCSADQIAVPFHIQVDGEWDRSRTWIFTRTDTGLRLKHDHRHADGTSDAVTMYGGDTADEGTARAQSFPVDAESIAMFEAEGLAVSVTNVWSVEVDPAGTADGRYVYQLKRTEAGGAPEDRLFRVEFDVTQAVEAPPAAWGWE
ncbi:hypothetical protein [Qipengyuania sp. ASV99]|uniref:hypothetical protein n=1 Tax=Qipengyuania sp. ASV99 TaxID=3399681 RepID=UPI003A4C801E